MVGGGKIVKIYVQVLSKDFYHGKNIVAVFPGGSTERIQQ